MDGACDYPWERRSILLATIPKSGTNYFRLFLTNYLNCLRCDASEPVTYREMHYDIFPNQRADYREGKKPRVPPHRDLIEPFGYEDFLYQHGTTWLEHFEGKGILLFRNPLDVLVSSYYFFHKNLGVARFKPPHPRDVIELYLPLNSDIYNSMKSLARSRSNYLMISYENMKLCPHATFEMVVRWLSLPFRRDVLDRALRFSSIQTVRQEERRDGAIHMAKKNRFEGFFTRSGEVGQWKSYFDSRDLDRIAGRLGDFGIKLDEFTLAPEQEGGIA